MEYLRGNKSVRQLLKQKLQSPESIRKDYYDTIKVTKSWFDALITDIEGRLYSEDTVDFAIGFADEISKDEIAINSSRRWQLYLPYHSFLYFLCRIIKPEIVVETGVERGSSTYVILKAMEENNKGTLHSVELCKEISLGKTTVPLALMLNGEDELKKRWVLHIGDSLKVIPDLVKEFGLNKEIDLFIHGSDHSYGVQDVELSYAKVWVKNGSYVVCDRNDYNNSVALNEVFPENKYKQWVLPEKSVKSSLTFAVVKV